MMKLNKVTIADHSVETVGIKLKSMAREEILSHLGVVKLGPMDSYELTIVHTEPVVKVVLAQEKPWTYITHVFTLAYQEEL